MNAVRCAALATIVASTWCSAGCTKAEPVTLASDVGFPEGLAVRGGTLYWADSRGSVLGVATAGGSVTTVVSGQDTTWAVAVDDAYLYWANQGTSACSSPAPCTPVGSIVKRPLSGGGSTTLATSQDAPQGMAVAGGNVFWVNQDPNLNAATGIAMQVGAAGGTPITLGTNVWTAGGIATDGASVYWADYGSMGIDGAIVKTPVGGGPAVVLAPSDGAPGALAVDGSDVYWSDGDDFLKVPAGGGVSQPFAVGVGNSVAQFAQDDANIYWVDQLDQKVLSTPKNP